MEEIKDLEKRLQRLELLWHNEILDRCCVSVEAPKHAHDPYIVKQPTDPIELRKWYMDGDWILKRNLEKIQKTHYAGDAMPNVFPYFGTGGHAKYVCTQKDVEYTPDTIWIHPMLEDYHSFDFTLHKDNPFLVEELKVLTYLATEGRGKFFVGFPDNTGSFDALSQLRGNVPIMMDLLDNPEEVKHATNQLVDILIESGDQIFDVLKKNNLGGSTHSWMTTWSPGRHAQLQCDASVMMSNQDFETFIVPELTRTSQWLDNATYHFDGMEQIRHLDSLLSIDTINMIQWTQVDGQPPVTQFIPELKRIQQAGKGLMLLAWKHQVKELLDELSPRGIILRVLDAKDAEEAEDIVSFVSKY